MMPRISPVARRCNEAQRRADHRCRTHRAGAGAVARANWASPSASSTRPPAPGTTSRALAVQARTLELYRQLDLTDAVLERDTRFRASIYGHAASGRRVSHLRPLPESLTPYGPFIFPQDQHERLLIERLAAAGVSVERNTELLRFSATPDGDQRNPARTGRPGGVVRGRLSRRLRWCAVDRSAGHRGGIPGRHLRAAVLRR